MANIIAEAFALYNNTNNIPVGYVIRDILFKNGDPLGCGSASDLSLGQSGFWHRSRPCLPLDAFIVFSDQGCFPEGQATTFGICPEQTGNPQLPLSYPLAVIKDRNRSLSRFEYLSFRTAHEIGHLLTGRDHLDTDSSYPTSCPNIYNNLLVQCSSGNSQGLGPIMCSGGSNLGGTLDDVYIDDCSFFHDGIKLKCSRPSGRMRSCS